ncbi:MAG: hypothetical protein R2777_00450 [Chitinophagales bacterium]
MKLNKISLFSFSPKTYFILILLLFIVSFIGLFIPIMEVDATQYASMSLELLQSNSLLHFTDLSEAYLDKPPLLLGFKLFYFYTGQYNHCLQNRFFYNGLV